MTALVELDTGEHAGGISLAVRLRADGDDVYMLDYIAIPIAHDTTGPPLESLYDKPASLTLGFTSPQIDEPIGSVTQIQLVRGEPATP